MPVHDILDTSCGHLFFFGQGLKGDAINQLAFQDPSVTLTVDVLVDTITDVIIGHNPPLLGFVDFRKESLFCFSVRIIMRIF